MKIVFMGTPDFAVPSLQALHKKGYKIVGVVTQPDRPKGRGQKMSAPPVKEAALQLGLRIYQPVKIKEEGFIKQLEDLQPDLICVVAFGQILPERILNLPPLGCINVHASLLPAYRGAAPIHWSILRGEKKTGITTMLMNAGMDTGDMLLQKEVEITPEMTCGRLHDELKDIGAQLLLDTIELWKAEKLKPIVQDESIATYASLLKREHELLDWQECAEKVNNKIRGLDPWPGAYTVYDNKILKIRGAKIYEAEMADAKVKAGTVMIKVKGEGFVVQTGKGSVLITKVQPFGKKIMTADSFMNGYNLEVGYEFSSCKYG